MAELLYDKLAREALLMLIDSGGLRSAAKAQLVAYETYYLPPRVALELPDRAGYAKLLNPHTTAEHSRRLADAILTVARTEESDTWVIAEPSLEVAVTLAIGRRRPRATPKYGVDDDAPVKEAARAPGAPLLRVLIDDEEVAVLREGAGLLTVVDQRWRPRISLMEAPERGPEVAFLLADGGTHVATADGREKHYKAPARIPISHDLSFEVGGRAWRPWDKGVRGRVEVLGVSRMARPELTISDPMGETSAWDRNTQPRLEIGEHDEARIRSHAVHLALRSGARDRVEVEALHEEAQWLTWYDGRPLRVSPSRRLPLQGSHLTALGRDDGQRLEVRLASTHATPAPRLIEVHGWSPPAGEEEKPFAGLFGFEQPVAVVWEDGQVLEPGLTPGPLRVPVFDPALIGPLCAVALDGCPGCKLMPYNRMLAAEGHRLTLEAWTWFEGITSLTMPGGRWRLEALERVQLIYNEPRQVKALSADPEDAWHVQGWTVRVVGDELEISGGGRVPARLDRRPLDGTTRASLSREHRLSIGHGVYRIVRRHAEVHGGGA